MIEENKQENKSDNAWLRPVLIFYAKVTSWIVLPLIIAIFLGKYARESTGQGILFFIAVTFGFLITCFGIYREIKEYKKTIDDIDNGNK